MSRRRQWNYSKLNIETAQQAAIAEGDIVRSYDFPDSRDDFYVEGVAEKIEEDRVLIHVTREVFQGEDEQVSRFKVWSPRGVSMFHGVPCLFLIAKRRGKRG